MSALKVGQRIQNVSNIRDNPNRGKFGVVTRVSAWSSGPHYDVRYDDGAEGSGNGDAYQPVGRNSNTFMSKVSNMMKKLLDADTQKLVKAGFINGDLELTSRGEDALRTILFVEKKAEMVTAAQEFIAEEESERKNG